MESTPARRRGRPRLEKNTDPDVIVDLDNVKEQLRPSMRPELRDEDPVAAAEKRAAEIFGNMGSIPDSADEFYIDPTIIPPGWTYEWKRFTVYNEENAAYQIQLAQTGWTPVPASRHPFLMPTGYKNNTIDRKGQRLMERPQIVTDRIRGVDNRRAKDQVRQKEQQLSATPDGQLPRDADPRTKPMIRKSYEGIPTS